MANSEAWAMVAGVGSGTGACVAQKFAQRYSVALLARDPTNYTPVVDQIKAAGGVAIGISADVTEPASMKDALRSFQQQTNGGAQLTAAVYNVGGSFIRKPFLELSTEEFMMGIEANGKGGFLFSRAVLPLLLKSTLLEHPPTLIFTSATAANRGSAQLASFSTGKFALKSLAQSLAREFGPQGVHVAHAIIDGVIDIEKMKGWKVSDAPDAKISPNAVRQLNGRLMSCNRQQPLTDSWPQIADTYWFLHTQPRSCFTHEIDIRPYVERW